jgi:4-amino-4-deoxy-L-arabinose transferase-like glycosyltransferase
MSRKTYLIIVIIISCLCIYLGLKGLDNAMFWDDEAQVGVMAKNYLKMGHLTGWDGRNLYGYRNGGALDENLRPVNPPLDIMLCAGSFNVFGVSTWSARFPFVLAGLLALLVFLKILDIDFGDNHWLKLFILLSFSLSAVYLLNIRQARYYSLSLLFSLSAYYCYQRYRYQENHGSYLVIALVSVLSFYANPMLCAGFLLSMTTYHLLFNVKRTSKKEWVWIASSALLFFVLTVPYAVYYKIWIRHDYDFLKQESWFSRKLTLFFWNIRDLNLINVVPWMILAGCLYYWWRDRKQVSDTKSRMMRFVIFGCMNVFWMIVLSPQPAFDPAAADVRYLFLATPFLAVIPAYLLYSLNQQYKVVCWLVYGIYISTNLFCIIPFGQQLRPYIYPPEFKVLLPAYLKEIHHPYPTGYEAAIRYLKENASRDDYVFALPDHYNYSMLFYLGDRLKFGGSINEYTHLDVRKIKQLDPRIYIYDLYPNWLVVYGYQESLPAYLAGFSNPHEENGKMIEYRYEPMVVLPYHYDQIQRPELFMHSFGPKPVKDLQKEGVVVFKRTNMH